MKIVHYPHPTLRHRSKPIRRVDRELVHQIKTMFELMYEANGIGLAANQVDLPLQLFVINVEAAPDAGEELVFINPVLSMPKGSAESEEGCLSLPGLYGKVTRPKQVQVQAFNLQGNEVKMELDGLMARVVQHEYDHLQGILFTDRMNETGRLAVKPALDEFELEFKSQRATGNVATDEEIRHRLAELEQRYCSAG